jgi:very-long-chain enoyl-CoA reductase
MILFLFNYSNSFFNIISILYNLFNYNNFNIYNYYLGYFIQYYQLIELILIYYKIIKSNFITSFIQNLSRILCIHLIYNDIYKINMFIIWSIADSTRCLYNLHKNNNIIYYMRYNFYKFLYPLGCIHEIYGLTNYYNNIYINLLINCIYVYTLPQLMVHINKNDYSNKISKYLEKNSIKDNIDINKDTNIKEIIFNKKKYYLIKNSYDKFYNIYNNEINPRFIWKNNELKDYGLQISWKYVFIIEYLGGLIMYPYILLENNSNNLYNLSLYIWIIHYCKRLLETLFIHKFSKSNMPITNLFKNSIYYWGTSIFLSLIQVNNNDNIYIYKLTNNNIILLLLWIISELSNFKCHYIQSISRKKNEYILLNDFLFKYVCCPNYTTEICGWIIFSLLSTNIYTFLSKLLFAIIGGIQMYIWSKNKHKRNITLFADKYKVKYLLFYKII